MKAPLKLQPPSMALRAAWLLLAGLAACDEITTTPAPQTLEGVEYAAAIRRTSYGIVHITADDLPSAAYAQGYAHAEDYICILADQFVKLRSERAKFFGRGQSDANLDSDFAYLALDIRARARAAEADQTHETRAIARGYVAGYNRYLEEHGAHLPEPCADAGWVTPITEEDLFAHMLDVAWVGPVRSLLGAIANAAPPSAALEPREEAPMSDAKPASNAWAIGGERTETGRGALLANPHFPWMGELRMHEAQLTVPGRLDVYGATLIGLPGVMIGFNEHIAWTATVSASSQTAVYKLALDSTDPTRYRLDGDSRAMSKRTLSVEVAGDEPVTRTLYATELGPLVRLPGVGWNEQIATAIDSTNYDCFGMLQQFLRMDEASNVAEFKAALAEERSIPWANIVYADHEGHTFYADAARVPDLPADVLDELSTRLQGDALTQQLWQKGLIWLDGTSSQASFRYGDGRSRVVTFEHAPQLEREDFVLNSNDAFTWTNPAASIAQPSPLYRGARLSPSARTRLGLSLLSDRSAAAASGPDAKWSLSELEDINLRGDSLIANALHQPVLSRCEEAAERGDLELDGQRVAVAPACAALRAWDGRVDSRSSGGFMWREFLSEFSPQAFTQSGPLFAIGPDPGDPLHTPRELAPAPETGADPIVVALGRALLRLQSAGVDPAARLGSTQFAWIDGVKTPISGAPDFEGSLNQTGIAGALDSSLLSSALPAERVARRPEQFPTGLTNQGYYYTFGTSFLLALEFEDDGPHARALMVYGESADPNSPHSTDQTRLYSGKQWRPVLFRADAIARDPELTVVQLGNRTRAGL